MYWVTPGGYYILAGRPTAANPMAEMLMQALGGAGAAGNRVPATKGYAFYPGVADIQNARAIDLQPGTELQAIDVTLAAKPRTYTIRGRLIDSKTGQPPAQANVFVFPQAPGLSGGDSLESRLSAPNQNYNAPTGKIEIRDLMPGVYLVMAVALDPLAFSRGGTPNQSIGALSVVGLPPGFYVKQARLGDADVLNSPLHVSGPTSNSLEILVSPNVGSIEGVAVDAAGQPLPGAQVVLIPNRNRHRTELFRPVAADSTGRFVIASIAPGEYTLAAWDAIEPYAFFDPELMVQAERQGKGIRVAESSKQTVNVTAIAVSGR
jgi:hypothetical protein